MASSNKAQDAYIDTVADEDATGDLHELYDRVRNGIVILMTYSLIYGSAMICTKTVC